MGSLRVGVVTLASLALIVIAAVAAFLVGTALERRVDGGSRDSWDGRITAPSALAVGRLDVGGLEGAVGAGHRISDDRLVHSGALAAVPDGELWIPSGQEMPFEMSTINVNDIPDAVQVHIGRLEDVPLSVGVIDDGGMSPWRCIWMSADAICADVAAVGMPGQPERYLTYWYGVPETASVVTLTGGVTELWQRPVSRLAAFVVESGRYKITAYDATGRQLGRVNAGDQSPVFVRVDGG